MKKKVLGTLLSVAMVASMLVGCGGGEAETSAPAAAEELLQQQRKLLQQMRRKLPLQTQLRLRQQLAVRRLAWQCLPSLPRDGSTMALT